MKYAETGRIGNTLIRRHKNLKVKLVWEEGQNTLYFKVENNVSSVYLKL